MKTKLQFSFLLLLLWAGHDILELDRLTANSPESQTNKITASFDIGAVWPFQKTRVILEPGKVVRVSYYLRYYHLWQTGFSFAFRHHRFIDNHRVRFLQMVWGMHHQLPIYLGSNVTYLPGFQMLVLGNWSGEKISDFKPHTAFATETGMGLSSRLQYVYGSTTIAGSYEISRGIRFARFFFRTLLLSVSVQL